MAGDPADKRASYADVLAAPEDLVAEVVHGRLYTHPRPRLMHARTASRLGQCLGDPFDRGVGGPGGWILLDEPELHLGPDPDILVPDLGGWRRDRMPELPDEPYAVVAPNWICEVLSPSTEDVDRAEKLPVYAREGVEHAWLVNPALELLEVLHLDGAEWRLAHAWRGNAVVRAEPFADVELRLADLWAR